VRAMESKKVTEIYPVAKSFSSFPLPLQFVERGSKSGFSHVRRFRCERKNYGLNAAGPRSKIFPGPLLYRFWWFWRRFFGSRFSDLPACGYRQSPSLKVRGSDAGAEPAGFPSAS
jgi:hypothetical protein